MSLHKEDLGNEQSAFENERVVIHYSTEGKVVTKKTAEVEHKAEEHGGHDYEGLETIPFVPHHALKEAISAIIFLIIGFIFIAIIPAPLEGKANSFESPTGVLPEWYFLAPFEFMHLFPPLVGIALQGVVIGLFLVLPFLDRKTKPIMSRKLMFPGSLLAIAIFVVLSAMALLKSE
jgi:quinol-cytochrome oxidoreductase complex cytochrome b subunit